MKYVKILFLVIGMLFVLQRSIAKEYQSIWPVDKMPDAQLHQVDSITGKVYNSSLDKHRVAYLEWYEAPDTLIANNACIIFISEGFNNCCDEEILKQWYKTFSNLGFQCVSLVYRTSRPIGLPFYQTLWEDGQRAIRVVRSEAKKRNFNPEKIGVISMSRGSHLALLLATSSNNRAYAAVDNLDSIPCHINYEILSDPAYIMADGGTDIPTWLQRSGIDAQLSTCFSFDAKTCPICFLHWGGDEYFSNISVSIYRRLRERNIPAELHLYSNNEYGVYVLERGIEFLRQIGIMGNFFGEEDIMKRYASDEDRKELVKQNIWPKGKMPNAQGHQLIPYIEWHFPKVLKSKAIQIIYSGGAYEGNDPDGFEVAPVRRFLNKLGMTVVTLRYRTPRPKGLVKYITAWEDLQRTVRIVRSQAKIYGLDSNQIGIMGSSAGGHLTLLGVTSSLRNSYIPIDEIDTLSCNVQWGIGIYPAYVLTDGIDGPNINKGNEYDDVLVSEFSFDSNTAPMLFIHGDADIYSPMGSVKAWEKIRNMGVQVELHTLALRNHCFQSHACRGTGSYTWLERIEDFLRAQEKFSLIF